MRERLKRAVLKTSVQFCGALVSAWKTKKYLPRATDETAYCSSSGEVAEWLMAPVLKTGIPERVSGVRIPPSPPDL
jgi:hypothetical protein